VREGIVASQHDIEGRRADGKGPHVSDQAAQSKSATSGFLTGALDRGERDVGARDPEALCRQAEGLGADANRGVEDAVGRRTPLTGQER
jgi:hypothetical protein